MSESNPTALIACTDNGNGRCASHDNGRHVLDANGLCKIGRRLRKEMCECPVCKSQFPAKSGMVLADQREEATAFSALNALIAQVGDNAVCSKCAQESNEDFDRAIFVTPEAFRKSVKDFVEKFQRGATVMHRHEWLGGQMRNWCDHCGRLVALDAEENMGGVIRGNSVICLCEHCNALAHEALPDLPTVSFFEGLEQVSSFRRPQPKPVTAPQTEFSREDRPARPALPSAPAPTPRQAETEPAQGEEIESAPTVAVPSTPARKPLASVKDIYDALLAGDRRVNFGVTNKNTMLTGCTVHSTRSSLCKTPEGSRWEQMRSVVRDGKAYGFCPTCTAELSVSGVRLEMTHKEAMVQIGVATNGNNGGVNRERLEFPDPTARAGKSVSNARKRELAQNALERAELEKKLTAKLSAIDRQIEAERAKIKPAQTLAAAASLKLSSAHESLRDKQDELSDARESSADSDTIELLELEIEELQDRVIKLEEDSHTADELLVEEQSRVDSAVAKMQSIRDQVERASPLGLREPHIHQVRSTREERTGRKSESKKDKDKKKDRGRNGGSKAA